MSPATGQAPVTQASPAGTTNSGPEDHEDDRPPPGQRRCPGVGTEAASEFTVEANTPESTPTPDLPQATRRRDRIKLLLGSMIEQRDKVLALVTEAQESEDHRALGYPSWTAFVAAEFGGLLTELNRPEKQTAALMLAATGMSARAIAPLVGLSKSAVARDTSQVSHRGTPDLAAADEDAEQDLEQVPAEFRDASEEEFEAALSSARADDDLSQQNVVRLLPGRSVTSLNGKGWTPPAEPRKPRRRPLPDAHKDALYDLGKVVERLERLHADDRFAGHRAELAQGRSWTLGDLASRAATLAQQLRGESR